MALRLTDDEYTALLARRGETRSAPPAAPHPKPTKYRAQKTTIDGITFDSKGEAARYCGLRLMEKAGEISDLWLQPEYPIEYDGIHICTYRADFRYRLNGVWVTEDFKGYRTPEYRLKKRLVWAFYRVEIKETGAKKRRK